MYFDVFAIVISPNTSTSVGLLDSSPTGVPHNMTGVPHYRLIGPHAPICGAAHLVIVDRPCTSARTFKVAPWPNPPRLVVFSQATARRRTRKLLQDRQLYIGLTSAGLGVRKGLHREEENRSSTMDHAQLRRRVVRADRGARRRWTWAGCGTDQRTEWRCLGSPGGLGRSHRGCDQRATCRNGQHRYRSEFAR